MKKTLIFFLFVWCFTSGFSQEVKTTLSKAKVELGEPFQIRFELEIKAKDKISFNPQTKQVAILKNIKNSLQKDTVFLDITGPFEEKNEKIQGKLYWQGNYTVTCFEEGMFVVPPSAFRLNGKAIMSNPVLLVVHLVPKKENVDLYDIEETFTEIPSPFYEQVKRIISWSLLFLLVIAIVIFFIVFLRKQKTKPVEEVRPSQADLKSAAIAELNVLMRKELWKNDELKTHFTELSLIVRRYLSKELGHSFLEKTSFEIQFLLRNKNYPERWLRPLGLILNVSDMVKFAQSSLQQEGVFSIYDEAKKFIEEFDLR